MRPLTYKLAFGTWFAFCLIMAGCSMLYLRGDAQANVEKRGYSVTNVQVRFFGCFATKDRAAWTVTTSTGERFKVCNSLFFPGTVVTPIEQ